MRLYNNITSQNYLYSNSTASDRVKFYHGIQIAKEIEGQWYGITNLDSNKQ